MSVIVRRPVLIQKCFIFKGNGVLKYEYIRSNGFEHGPNNKEEILESIRKTPAVVTSLIEGFGRDVPVFIVAPATFDFTSYLEVIKGLVNEEWATVGSTHLGIFLKRFLGIKCRCEFTIDTEIWFDFDNGAFFTFMEEKIEPLILNLSDTQDLRKKALYIRQAR